MFAGSDGGAETAATILTVLETAKSFGVDPRAYLHDVLVKISSGPKMSRLAELMPEQWVADQADQADHADHADHAVMGAQAVTGAQAVAAT